MWDYITYRILVKYSPEEFVLAEVTFKSDFPPWIAGEKVDLLEIDFGKCEIHQLSVVDNRILKTGYFEIIPKSKNVEESDGENNYNV